MEAIVTKTEVQQIGSTLPTIRLQTDDTALYGQVSKQANIVNMYIQNIC